MIWIETDVNEVRGGGKMAKKLEYKPVVAALYRTIRVFIATGVAEAVLVKPDWSNVEVAVKALSVAFISGVISGVFKYLRDKGISPDRLPL